MMDTHYYEVISMKCVGCGQPCQDIDMMCDSCRRKRYDTKSCASCGRDYDGKQGWYVPSFGGYIDVHYECPECLVELKKIYEYKNKRLKEIPEELMALEAFLPHDTVYTPIYKTEEGEYRYSEFNADISLDELVQHIEFYKQHEDEFAAEQKAVEKFNSKLDALRKEEKECFVGSGYCPRANT